MALLKSKKASKDSINAEVGASSASNNLAVAYDAKRRTSKKKMAAGGPVEADTSPEDKEMPAVDMDPMSNEDNTYMDHESVADKILRKHSALKKEMYEDADNMYARGGMITDESDEDNGHADYMLNGVAQPSVFEDRNRDMMDENMNDPIMDADYPPVPSDKNPHDEDDDSILSRIRRKMKK